MLFEEFLQSDDSRCFEGVTCKYGGKCQKVGNAFECVCPASCLPSSLQVCGSDGGTYQSLCHLKQSSCRLQKAVSLAYAGSCEKGFLFCMFHFGICGWLIVSEAF